jgi:hypothetical protein
VRWASLCGSNVCGMRRTRIVAAVSRAVTAGRSDGPLLLSMVAIATAWRRAPNNAGAQCANDASALALGVCLTRLVPGQAARLQAGQITQGAPRCFCGAYALG